MRPERWTPARHDWAWFAAFAAVLVALRLFLIVTQQWTARFDGDLPEALASGRGAFDVLNGTWRGWHTYLHFTGGHLGNEIAASVAALPLFWLFGPSLLAMTAVPIAAAVVMAALIFGLSRSRGAAIMATAYFVCMPLAVQSWQIYPYMTHAEAVLWFLLALWILRPVFDRGSFHVARPVVAGLALGAGVVINDLVVAALPSIAGAWYLSRSPRPQRRVLVWIGAGVAVGMLPYAVYAVVRPDSVALFYRTLFGLFGEPTDVSAYFRPFALGASMLWPLANVGALEPARILVGLTAVVMTAWWGRSLLRLSRPPLIDLAIVTFIAIVGVIQVVTRLDEEYYSYALAPLIAFVAGGMLADFTGHSPAAMQRAVRWSVVGLGCVLTASSVANLRVEPLRESWRAIRVARGYAFYAPGTYRVFSGYKTPLGRAVESVLSNTDFNQPAGSGLPEKAILIAKGLHVSHPLLAREDYLVYGADVTYLGVERLAATIRRDVPPEFWPEAFGSTAVVAANDFLIGEFVGMFHDGTIDRSVPECCVRAFYAELGRKIRDRSARQRADVRALIEGLTDERRSWIDSGIAGSEFVDYGVPAWPVSRSAR